MTRTPKSILEKSSALISEQELKQLEIIQQTIQPKIDKEKKDENVIVNKYIQLFSENDKSTIELTNGQKIIYRHVLKFHEHVLMEPLTKENEEVYIKTLLGLIIEPVFSFEQFKDLPLYIANTILSNVKKNFVMNMKNLIL